VLKEVLRKGQTMGWIGGKVGSEKLVETLQRHCETKAFKSSVKAFLSQFGVVDDIEDWERSAVVAAAYLKALDTSTNTDRRLLRDCAEGIADNI
jgi:hypothetical protein